MLLVFADTPEAEFLFGCGMVWVVVEFVEERHSAGVNKDSLAVVAFTSTIAVRGPHIWCLCGGAR